MKRALWSLLAVVCLGAGLGDQPLAISGLSPGQTAAQVAAAKGQPEKVLDGDLMVFEQGRLMVRMREDTVVYVGGTALSRAGKDLSLVGCAADYVRGQLGEPQRIYHKTEIDTWLYPSRDADLGILLQSGRVGGFVLQEPGTLGRTLEAAGYR